MMDWVHTHTMRRLHDDAVPVMIRAGEDLAFVKDGWMSMRNPAFVRRADGGWYQFGGVLQWDCEEENHDRYDR